MDLKNDNYDDPNDEDNEDDCDDCDECNFVKNGRNTKNSKKAVPEKPKIPISQRFKINRGHPINNLGDLITALDHKDSDPNQLKLVQNLNELNGMIGMTSLKEQIVNQILFFMQDLQEPGMFLHTVLYGPPGSGKTSCCHILAKIYSSMGILKTDKVVKAARSDLVGKYLGSTAIKTKEVLTSANGGILFLDEVYSLGNKEQTDSFSKECIDTINEYLSEHVDEFICIIAGYKEEVNECFFKYNPGLERRFPWKFVIDDYKIEELYKIMQIQLKLTGWSLATETTGVVSSGETKVDTNVSSTKVDMEKYVTKLIADNKNYFTGNGGDTRNLIDKCKICHARRVFTLPVTDPVIEQPKKRARKTKEPPPPPPPIYTAKKILNKQDIDAGLLMYIESKKEREKTDTNTYSHMYI